MCAIIAWKGQINNTLLRALYRRAIPYGPHSVGLVYQAGSEAKVFKRACHPEVFLRNCNHRIETASLFDTGIGHVRYATHGEVIDKNAHPFNYHGIEFVHNGVIGNYRSIVPDAVVDSECLGPCIAKRDLTEPNGSVGAAWMEDGELYVYRRNQGLYAAVIDWNFLMPPYFTGTTTLVASRTQIFPRLPGHSMRIVNLVEGKAYRVTNSPDLEVAWEDPQPTPTARSGSSVWAYMARS